MVLLTFGAPVLLGEAILTAWADDFDASFWLGTGSLAMSELGFAGLGTRNDSDFDGNAVSGSTVRAVDLPGLADPVDWLVFGVKPGQSNDKFKLKSLSVSLPPPPPPPPPPHQAPEEGVLALLGAGAFFLATRRRRLEASPHQGGL